MLGWILRQSPGFMRKRNMVDLTYMAVFSKARNSSGFLFVTWAAFNYSSYPGQGMQEREAVEDAIQLSVLLRD